jgi:hypothetical protein
MPGQDLHREGPASEPEGEPHRESSTADPAAAQVEPSGPSRTETDECYIPADVTHPEPDVSIEEHDSAEAIADQPRLWRALLFAHQADPHGRCLSCPGVRWPCGSRRLAERAQHLHDGAQRDRD